MKVFNIINFILIIGIIGFLIFLRPSEKKIAYVNNVELLNSFILTKELEQNLSSIEIKKQAILDSILVEIKSHGNKNNVELEKLKSIYISKRNAFSEEMNKIKQSSNDKIANQINQYVKEFGEENNIDYILGATGNANIWYSKEANDLTKDVITYVNKKYNDKK